MTLRSRMTNVERRGTPPCGRIHEMAMLASREAGKVLLMITVSSMSVTLISVKRLPSTVCPLLWGSFHSPTKVSTLFFKLA